MNKTILLCAFILLFGTLASSLCALFYINVDHGEGVELGVNITNQWALAGANAPDGVAAIPTPTLDYPVAIIPDSSATYNAAVFNQLLTSLDITGNTDMRIVSVPTGTFNIAGTLKPPSNLIIKGEGSGQTILNFIAPQIASSHDITDEVSLNAFEIIGKNHVGIEDLTIQRAGQGTYHDQLLDAGGMNRGDNVYFTGTINPADSTSDCYDNWVTGVESDNPFRHHIVIDNSQNITVSGCYFNDVLNRGRGGFGYGVNLMTKASKCLIENNIFRHNRHGIVLEDGAFYNVIAYNYIRDGEGKQEIPDEYDTITQIYNNYGDINLHGHNGNLPGATHNLIEGNNCDILAVDTSCGTNGERNVFLRNRIDKDGIHVFGYDGFPDWLPGYLVETAIMDVTSLQFLDLFLRTETASLLYCSECLWLKTADTYFEAFNNGPIHTFQNQPRQIFINNFVQNLSWWKCNIHGYPYRQHSETGQYERALSKRYRGFWGDMKETTIYDGDGTRSDLSYFFTATTSQQMPSYFAEGWPYGCRSKENPAHWRWRSHDMTFSRTDTGKSSKAIVADTTITADYVVDADEILKINPGVTVKFTIGHGIIVNGIMEAIGTNDQPIIFQKEDNASGWEGIHLSGTSNSSFKPSIKLSHCNFSDATDCALKLVHYSEAILDSCLFDDNTGMGAISADDGNLVLTRSTFTDNTRTGDDYGGAALILYNTTANIESCRFTGNTSHVKAGAIQITGTEADTCTVSLTNCYFRGNVSDASTDTGYGINADEYGARIDAINCSFSNLPKAIYSTLLQDMYITNSLFYNDYAEDNLLFPGNSSPLHKFILERCSFKSFSLSALAPAITVVEPLLFGENGVIIDNYGDQTGLGLNSVLVNAGNKYRNASETDVIDQLRVIGRNIDIGAFECFKSEVSIDTTEVDFGNTLLFHPNEHELVVCNMGMYDMTLDSLSVPQGYTVEPDSFPMIIPTVYCEQDTSTTDSDNPAILRLKITFTPLDIAINYADTLRFTASDSLGQNVQYFKISLKGAGVAAIMNASQDSLSLADFPANNTPSFGEEYVKVWNSGNIPLVIDSLSVPGQFQFALTTTAPLDKGIHSKLPASELLSGKPEPNKKAGKPSAERKQAASQKPAIRNNAPKTGEALSWVKSATRTINPNDTVYVKVRFTPYELKPYIGNMRFVTNDSYQAIHQISLIGQGDTLVVTPSPIPPEISGNINSDTLWVCPEIQVRDSVKVAYGKTLTIQPYYRSMKIKSDPYKGFIVEGNLNATNLADSLVTFTAANTALGWWGIQFRNNATGDSHFEHTVLEYGNNTNRSSTAGGGIFSKDYGTLALNYCSLRNNHAQGDGGSISSQNCVLAINHCNFTGNTASNGGAVAFQGKVNSQSYLNNSKFSTNSASINGGALYISGIGNIAVQCDSFYVNQADCGGAIATADKTYDTTISGCTFSENTATSRGGAIANDHSVKNHVWSSVFNSNLSIYGGAVSADSSSLDLYANHFNANQTDTSGGAVYAENCQLKANNNVFNENKGENGGAMAVQNSLYLIRNNTFSSNCGIANGGAIYVYGNTPNPVTCSDSLVHEKNIHSNVIKSNSADNQGGGVYMFDTCRFYSNALEDNEAAEGGGAYMYADSIHFDSNTVAGNQAMNGCGLYVKDYPLNMTNTLIWDNGSLGDIPIFLERSYHVNLTNCNLPLNAFEGDQATINKNNCLSINPCFEKYYQPNNFPSYSLNKISKCVNAGLPGTLVPNYDSDAKGQSRITDNHGTSIIDIGAYEFNGDYWELTDTTVVDTLHITYSPTYYRDNLNVPAGKTLLVDPWITFAADQGVSIEAKGIIKAPGTLEKQITFTGISSEDGWGGIHFKNRNNTERCEFTFTNFELGKANYANTTSDTTKINGGALYIDRYSNIQLENCGFGGNTATVYGGAVYAADCDSIIFSKCHFNANKVSDGAGGAIYARNTKLVLKDSNLEYNNAGINPPTTISSIDLADNGGAICITQEDTGNRRHRINGNRFDSNMAIACGGSIMLNSSDADITDNEFVRNRGLGYDPKNQALSDNHGGGAIAVEKASRARISDNDFDFNTANMGGAIELSQAYMECLNNHFVKNSATRAGGVYVSEAADSTSLTGNNFQENGTVGSARCESGGAVCAVNNIGIRIDHNKFNANVSDSTGGAIAIYESQNNSHTADIRNNLVTSNVSGSGGGLYFNKLHQAYLYSNTLVHNKANWGGGCYNDSSMIDIANSISWFNQAHISGPEFFKEGNSGSYVVSYSNLQGLETGFDHMDYNTAIDSNSCIGELTDDPCFASNTNGFMLRESSPSIDKGSDSFITWDYDLNHRDRISNIRTDMGCYEFSGFEVDSDPEDSHTIWDESLVTVSGPICVSDTLEICDNVTVFIEPGASILIDSGVLILGKNITIIADSTETENHLFLRDSPPIQFEQSNLLGCNLDSNKTSLLFKNSTLVDVHILQQSQSLFADDTFFSGSNIEAYNLPQSYRDTLSVMINNCIFENKTDSTAIRLYSYPRFNFSGNTISNYYSAISLFECGLENENEISNNTFTDNQFGYGIQLYHSYARIQGSNVIKNNFIGIAGLRNSDIQLCGSATPPFQVIYDQYNLEMAFMHDSFPGKMYHNLIYDIVRPTDNLIQCMDCPLSDTHDMSLNNWNNANVSSLLNPSEYISIQPSWVLSSAELPQITPEAEIYEMALNNTQIGNYDLAESQLRQIIDEYPDSKKYVELAAKQLLVVYSASKGDLFNLAHFYASEPNLHNETGIDKLATYLENCCDIKLGDYEAAVQWFESIIANPDTPQDSVYAMIDLAYTFLLMDQAKSAPTYTTLYPHLIPKSMQDFKEKSDEYIKLLLRINQQQQSITIPPPTIFKVYPNYPNPFNGTTTFAFDLPRQGKVTLAIYNIRGQIVKEYRFDSMVKGKQKVIWDCKNNDGRGIASGIYLYRIRYEGKSITKKMCYLK